jgi:uncharacterized membrane protein
MKQRLLILREHLQTSIWFIPAVFCMASLLLAMLLPSKDQEIHELLPWLKSFEMPVSSARNILGVIAGAVLSVGGVVFSVTMVALTLTSGQYGPKVLRQFLSGNDSKVCLGLFIGTSLYCLVTLAGYEDSDKPGFTVLVALVLTVIALSSFIHFIHRSATDLQADQIIGRIGGDLRSILKQLSEKENLQTRNNDILSWRRRARGIRPTLVATRLSGYVQTIDYKELLQWCDERGCVALVQVRPGDFISPGNCVIKLYTNQTPLQIEEIEKLTCCIRTGTLRTSVQDPEYPITQLNQLAARALSPGINDPGTAITCIDWFGMAIAQIIDRDFPGKVILGSQDKPVLLVRFTDFSGILKAFYAPARQLAKDNIPVLISLMDSLVRLAELTSRTDRLQDLAIQGRHVFGAIKSGNHLDDDLRGFRQRYAKLKALTQHQTLR